MTRWDAINTLLGLVDELESTIVDITSDPTFVNMADTVENILAEAEWLDMLELDMSDLLLTVVGFIVAGNSTQVVVDIANAVADFSNEYYT